MVDIMNNLDKSFAIQCYATENLEASQKYFTADHNLRILNYNIRSLLQNFDSLIVSLNRFKTLFDVVILTECWLNSDITVPSIPGYNSYCTKKFINKSGGVTAYVRDIWSATVTEPDIVDCNSLEICINGEWVIFGIYRSPSFKQIEHFLISLNTAVSRHKNKQLILWAGDLNIDLLGDPLSAQCTDYLCLAAEHQLIPAISMPTRNKTCIDHIFVKKGFEAVGIVCNSDITDHDMCVIGLKCSTQPPARQTRSRYKTDFLAVANDLKAIQWDSVTCSTDVNQAVLELNTILTATISKHSRTVTVGRSRFNLKPWVTPGLIRCQKNRDQLHIKAKKDPENKTLQTTYKRYRNFYKELLRRVRTQHEKEELTKNKKNPKKLWETINIICDNSKPHCESSDLILNRDPVTALNMCNNYFSNVGKDLAAKILNKTNESEQSLASSIRSQHSLPQSFFMTPTDSCEVEKLISGLRVGSAPGIDGHTSTLLKYIKHYILEPLTFIFNLSLGCGEFPDNWKLAVVVPIHKDGSKDTPSNYRPISLLSIFSKLLEKIVNIRLVNYLEHNRLLSDKQFGFRRGRSAEDAVVLLTNTVSSAVDQNQRCVGVFLDLAKAFDTVSIPILTKKLEGMGIRGVAQNWFSSYLTSRRQCVRVGSSLSSESSVNFGVPQGSILGPTLFAVYMNDVLDLPTPAVEIICYADDTVLVFRDSTWEAVCRAAESGINRVAAWLDRNLLTLNVKKTQFVAFYKTRKSKPKDKLNIFYHSCGRGPSSHLSCGNCETVTQVDHIKYLGVEIDETLSFKLHIKKLSGRVRKVIYVMKALRPACDKETLVMVYKSLCECIISYCILAWGGACKSVLIELERAQRAVLKVMLGKPFLYSTDALYLETKVLRVRQLFILKAIVAVHKDVANSRALSELSQKRVFRIPVPTVKSTFANRHPNYLLPRVYNKICKVCDIHNERTTTARMLVQKFLLSQSYNETENIIYI